MFYYTLYRIGQFLALHIPRRLAYKIAVLFSDIHYIFADQDRRLVRENLKVIFPEKSGREIRRIRRSMSRNFAKYLVDFFCFSKIDKEYIKNKIKIENLSYLDEALAKGRGVIAVTAHLGNWELGGALMGLLGYPMWAVALNHKHKKVNDFFVSQRESRGVQVIPLGRAVRQSLTVLQENKILGLVGDREFNCHGIKIDFFGKPTLFPEGPAALSLKTQAVIIPGFMLRNEDDTFTFKFEKPLEYRLSGNKDNDLREIIDVYKVIFEDYIRKYPEQWYMFRRFWI